jgi:2-iminoacetate synthase ThiH
MLKLNWTNVEELIFYDSDVQNLLPVHMFSIFEQWRLAKRVPFLRELGKQALLDFLNQLSESDIEVLESYFKKKIFVEKINYSISLDLKIPLSNICDELCHIEGFNYTSTFRDEEYLYLTLWR